MSTKGEGVKNPQNIVNVVYECPPDKGFLIEDLVKEKKAILVIPKFMKGRKQGACLNYNDETYSRIIAKARIFIEIFNSQFKNFLIVNQIVPQHHFPFISQLVYVAACFANFGDVLCK